MHTNLHTNLHTSSLFSLSLSLLPCQPAPLFVKNIIILVPSFCLLSLSPSRHFHLQFALSPHAASPNPALFLHVRKFSRVFHPSLPPLHRSLPSIIVMLSHVLLHRPIALPHNNTAICRRLSPFKHLTSQPQTPNIIPRSIRPRVNRLGRCNRALRISRISLRSRIIRPLLFFQTSNCFSNPLRRSQP